MLKLPPLLYFVGISGKPPAIATRSEPEAAQRAIRAALAHCPRGGSVYVARCFQRDHVALGSRYVMAKVIRSESDRISISAPNPEFKSQLVSALAAWNEIPDHVREAIIDGERDLESMTQLWARGAARDISQDTLGQ